MERSDVQSDVTEGLGLHEQNEQNHFYVTIVPFVHNIVARLSCLLD